MYGKVRCFYRHISRKRKTREYVDQLLKVTGDLVINDVENTQKKKKKKGYSCLQEWQEGRLGKLPASQLHLNPWKGDETYLPKKHFKICSGQEGTWE